MPAAVETMFYALEGGVPWHREGTAVQQAKTAREAFILAGLDWDVETRQLYFEDANDEGLFHEAEEYVGIVRVKDNTLLGTAQRDYVPLQNWEPFKFLDNLVRDGVARFDTAGSLLGGKRIWCSMLMDDDWRIGDDQYWKYMAFSNSHEGNRGVHIGPTGIRIVCANTLDLAFGADGQRARISIRHGRSMHQQLADAQRVLAITTETHRRMQKFLERALTHQLNENAEKVLINNLFPADEEDNHTSYQLNQMARFRDILNAEAERQGRTAYSAVQAITGYADHILRYNNFKGVSANERRLVGIMDGKSSQFKNRGLEILSELGVK